MATKALSLKQLNRALLARQLLLARKQTTPLRAIEALVGLQAQQAKPPFVGLWSRVQDFRREDLIRALQRRSVLRAPLMRATLHLMSSKDFVRLRAPLQPALSQGLLAIQRRRGQEVDVDLVTRAALGFLEKRPRTFEEVRTHLAARFPAADKRVLGYAVRTHLPVAMVPTDARWGYPGTAEFAAAETWLQRRIAKNAGAETLVRRYLAAFGPATPADAQTWSGLSGLRDVFEALRPQLRTWVDERGRELFDRPKAPLPPAGSPAAVRFVPDYDNLVLAHADRARIIRDEDRPKIFRPNLRVLATFLVDGFVAGTWKIERKRAAATLVVDPFASLGRKDRAALVAEGERLLHFVERDAAEFEVQLR